MDIQKQIEQHQELVKSIAKKYMGRGIEFEDLVQSGNIGLWKATEKFDANLGNKFTTYAYSLIEYEIKEAFGELTGLSKHYRQQVNKIKQIKSQLTQKFNRVPTDEEIAEEMDIDLVDVGLLNKISQNFVSLDSNSDDEKGSSIIDNVADENNISPEEHVINSHNDDIYKVKLKYLLDSLTPIEREIFNRRNFENKKSYEKIGKEFNIGRERIRTIDKKVSEKIKLVPTEEELENINLKKKKEQNMLKEIINETKESLGISAKDEKIAKFENYDNLQEIDFDVIKDRYDDTYETSTENKNTFSQFFVYLCEKYGITETTFNRATGLGRTHFINIKKGRSMISMEALVATGIYFKIDSSLIRDLLERGGYKFCTTNKVHSAYELLLAECSGYPIKYCNEILKYLEIPKEKWFK